MDVSRDASQTGPKIPPTNPAMAQTDGVGMGAKVNQALEFVGPLRLAQPEGAIVKMSALAARSLKQAPTEETSLNAQLLIRGGFVQKVMAGVYTWLPLGHRVLMKVEALIRKEMNAIGGQEMLLPALHPRELWDQTGRWEKFDVLYRTKGVGGRDIVVAPTHEEVVTPAMKALTSSYRDLPRAVYQFQHKFRNELRAKAGLLRGREFRMKDMYSFHTCEEDLDRFYWQVDKAYWRIFEAVGIADKTYLTFASGSSFSTKFSHEYQTLAKNGEDTIYVSPDERIAINHELINDPQILKRFDISRFEKTTGIETANSFQLGTKFSSAFNLTYATAHGSHELVWMGCYGLGTPRLVGTIVELHSAADAIHWPALIAPYDIHVVSLCTKPEGMRKAEEMVSGLAQQGYEVLVDDRADLSAGVKFKDAALIGIPIQLVIGDRSLGRGTIEFSIPSRQMKFDLPLSSVADVIPRLADIEPRK